MISDDELYRLAIFLGSVAMILIVLYHFLEINATEKTPDEKHEGKTPAPTPQQAGKASSAGR